MNILPLNHSKHQLFISGKRANSIRVTITPHFYDATRLRCPRLRCPASAMPRVGDAPRVDDASHRRCLASTMPRVDDASRRRCLTSTMPRVDDASCRRCRPAPVFTNVPNKSSFFKGETRTPYSPFFSNMPLGRRSEYPT